MNRRHKKTIKFFKEHLCKNSKCNKMIPVVVEFCSTDCREDYEKSPM